MSAIKSSAAALSIDGRKPQARTGPGWRRPVLIVTGVGAVLGIVLLSGGGQISGVAPEPHWPDLQPILEASPVIQIHLGAALAAVVLGGLMMTSRKGARFHRTAGWVWVSLMGLVAGSSLFITGLNGGKWSLIHLLSGWTLLVLPLAVLAAKRHDVKRHRGMMMGLFYGGLLIAGALAFIPGRIMWNVFL